MSESATQAVRSRIQKPELPVGGLKRWESWSTCGLLALAMLAVTIAVVPLKFIRGAQGAAIIFPALLAALAVLLLIIKMHLAAQRKLLREISAALLAATSRVERMEHFSFIDPQTELFNRRYLDRLFNQQAKWLNRSGNPVTMMLFQLAGSENEDADHLMVEAALLLRANFRGSDYVLRNSETQFLVLLPETDGGQSQIALHRLHDKLDRWNLENQHFEMALRQEAITCTPGASLWESLQALEEKLRRAPDSGNPVPPSIAIPPASTGMRESVHP